MFLKFYGKLLEARVVDQCILGMHMLSAHMTSLGFVFDIKTWILWTKLQAHPFSGQYINIWFNFLDKFNKLGNLVCHLKEVSLAKFLPRLVLIPR